MTPESSAEERTCPGERYTISAAICRTRQRNQYPKCLLCPHRDPELAGTMAADPKVKAAIFHATAVLGRVPDEVNEYVMRKVGLATAQFLRAEKPSASWLAVACDLRDNSRGFCRIFCEGANRGGTDTVYVGTVPPEVLAHVAGTDGCAGGAFIGGGNYADSINGARIWRADGSPVGFGVGLEKIGLIASRLRTGCSRLPGEMRTENVTGDYAAYVRKFAPKLKPLKVLVDAGYGSAGRLVEEVLAGLPVELAVRSGEEDGHNPFLGRLFPCSDLVDAMKGAVRDEKAALGVAIDFTGERVAFFDERGTMLRHDVAAGLVAGELLARNPEASIAYDLRATAALHALIRQSGGTPLAGPTSRLAFAQHFRRNDALYGADMDGLHYFRDFHRFASPVLALLTLCSRLSREDAPVSEQASPLNSLSRSGEVSIKLNDPGDVEEVLAGVREEFADADRESIDGLTVRLQDWWFNLRQAGGKAELRLNVEARNDRDLRRGRQTIERLVSRLAGRAGA
jgi:phosphomannomutase